MIIHQVLLHVYNFLSAELNYFFCNNCSIENLGMDKGMTSYIRPWYGMILLYIDVATNGQQERLQLELLIIKLSLKPEFPSSNCVLKQNSFHYTTAQITKQTEHSL